MKKLFNSIVLSFTLMMLIIGCGGGASKSDNNIVISGSSSVAPLMFKLAAKFEELNNNYKVVVETSDSTIGVQDTINNNNSIGMASRALTEDENSQLDSLLLCNDALVIIVNKDSSLSQVSEEELYNLFINNTPIADVSKAISREDGSGTKSAFKDLTSIGKDAPLPSTVEVLNGTGQVKTSVAADSSKMGYISLGAIDGTVKALSYKAKDQADYVVPTVENVSSGDYKLYRPFYIFTKKGKEQSEATKMFLEFLNTEEAKNVINSSGYVAIN